MIENKPTILLVEDNPINIVVIKKLLGTLYNIDTITSGNKLLVMLENSEYQLILTDINLGDDEMSGVEVMKRVRSNPKTTHLPVIAVTAYSLADDIERFREQGFTDCVPKPVSRENLLKVLAKYIT